MEKLYIFLLFAGNQERVKSCHDSNVDVGILLGFDDSFAGEQWVWCSVQLCYKTYLSNYSFGGPNDINSKEA